MPTIDADTTGFFGQIQLTSWLDARDATSALFLTSTTSVRESANAMWNAKTAGRGGFIYRVYRAYAMFPTSGITSVTNATLKVKGLTNRTLDFVAVKANAMGDGSALALADFDAIDGWDGSGGVDNTSNVTKYFDDIDLPSDPFSITGYNEIELNAAARSDMESESKFEMMFIGVEYDLTGTSPSTGTSVRTGLCLSPHNTHPIQIVYNETADYSHSILGVSSGNIASVNGVQDGKISNINGVG